MVLRAKSWAVWKRLPALALTVAVLLLVAGLSIAALNEKAYRVQKASEAGVQARILAATVAAALSFDDREAAREYVGALAANSEIRSAAVYDAAGELFVAYSREGDEPVPELAADAAPAATPAIGGGVVAVSAPVVQGDAVLGSVRLHTTLEPLVRRLERYGGLALLVTMASLVVVVLGVAHAALSRANAELRKHASALEDAYAKLRAETAERERVEDALRQSQKMEAVGQLTGGVAHDFNNLLQAVGGSLDVVERRLAAGRTDVERYIKAAREAVDRAAVLTQRLLAFSRRQPLTPRSVDLNRLVDGMQELIRRSVGQSIQVQTQLADGLWPTWADAHQIENALLNLVINARDAMPDGGRLTIETRNTELDPARMSGQPGLDPGPYVALTVTDTGTGMAPDVMARAFEPFFTTKPIGQGTGLGLSQLYGFARQSGGHASIASEPGRGTAVTLYLPRHAGHDTPEAVAAAANTDAAPAVPAAEPGRCRGTVLVVEDEALVRMLLVGTLRERDYTVIEAEDAPAALTILESPVAIDLLATDIGLPGTNGRQLAEMARTLRPGLRVLFLTGYAHGAGLDRVALGPDMDLLTKPVAMDTFIAKVQAMTAGRIDAVSRPSAAG